MYLEGTLVTFAKCCMSFARLAHVLMCARTSVQVCKACMCTSTLKFDIGRNGPYDDSALVTGLVRTYLRTKVAILFVYIQTRVLLAPADCSGKYVRTYVPRRVMVVCT